MTSISDFLKSPESQAVLHLDLVEKLPAHEFSSIMSAIDQLYFGHLWLGLAQATPRARPIPDPYQPNENEKLYIEHLEVGTPNLLELIGQASSLIPTFATVATAMGVAKVTADVINKVAGAKKAFAETRKVNLQSEMLKLDLAAKASQLQAQGRITAEQARHKLEIEEESGFVLRNLLPAYARAPQLRLIDPGSSGVALGPGANTASRAEDAERRLRALVKAGQEQLVSEYLAAHRQYLRDRSQGSQARLRKAHDRLVESSGLSEEHLREILRGLEP